jgi:aspartate racemase
MNDKVIGIIGGMGPEATASLYMKIIKGTKVTKDQEHFRVIIDSNPKVPDRTKAILWGGESPVKAITETAKNLEKLGVDVACIPCMTSHFFIEEIQEAITYPIINAFTEVHKFILNAYPEVKNIGVLATSGTITTGLFDKYLHDVNIVYPCEATQANKVMEAIYGDHGIKSGNLKGKPLDLLVEAGNELIQNGAQLIILGCTEIELVLKKQHLNKPLIDPMEVMTNVLINK